MFLEKVNKFFSNINLREAFKLIYNISPIGTVITIVLLIAENIGFIVSMYSFKILIDKLVKTKADTHINITYYMLFTGGTTLLFLCIRGFSAYFNEIQAAKVNQNIDHKIHLHTIQLNYEYYENPEYLNILKRAREAGTDRPYAMVAALLDIAKNFVTLCSMAYMLIAIDWKLLPLLALFVFPILLVRINFSDKMYKWQKKNTGLEREASYLSHMLTGDISAKEIRAFSLASYMINKYVSIKEKLLRQRMKLNRRRALLELFTTLLSTSAFFAVMSYIIYGTFNGRTSVGDIAIFLVIFPQSFSLLQSLIGAISRLYQNNIYLTDIFELFNLQPNIEVTKENKHNQNPDNKNDISIENLSFKYPHSTDLALIDVNMKIPSGKIIALVGLNGAGKSTFIKLLCRLYDPTEGTIKMNNINIKDQDIKEYRRKISVVFQDFVKFNMSVTENIWFGNINEDINMHEIKQASINSGASLFVDTFPEQFDTVLGRVFDNGHEISIGQWQKIAIARAFYNKSKLVILDEATSALDSVSEHELFKTIREKLENRSALVISHRLTTIRQADYIYVMGNKTILEHGTHDELIALKGRYYELCEPE